MVPAAALVPQSERLVMAPLEPGEIDGSVTDVPGGVASSSDLVSSWRSAAYASSSLSRSRPH
jgi:hypothetical protein